VRPTPLAIIAGLILLVVVILAAFGFWLRSELETDYYTGPQPETYLDIPRGVNTKEVADLLAGIGILHRRLPFLIYLRYSDMGRHIQAGEYRFSKAETPIEIAQRLVKGDVYFRSVTIPEGLTAQETIDLLVKNGLGDASEMNRALLKTDWIVDLDPGAKNLEGYLFPETYRFGRKVSSEKIIKTMVDESRTRIARVLAKYPAGPGWTISRIVTLASMIEKEVKTPEERPLVASVLIKRLEKRMPLACDATIIYALKLSGEYDGKIHKSDLAIESPYNSYVHLNLPPGPIANPGEGSLRAALHPAKTDYLFYVSRNDGTHQFSKDLHEHLHAVDRFQKSWSGRQLSMTKKK
jgi:UPF0755 protein